MGNVTPRRSWSAPDATSVTARVATTASGASIPPQRCRGRPSVPSRSQNLHFVPRRNLAGNIRSSRWSRWSAGRRSRHVPWHPVRHKPVHVYVRRQVAHIHIPRLWNHLHWVHSRIRVWSTHHITRRNRLRRIDSLLLRGHHRLSRHIVTTVLWLLLLLLSRRLRLLRLLLALIVRIAGVRRHARRRSGHHRCCAADHYG